MLERFSSPATTLIFLHSRKTNRKKKQSLSAGAELSTNNASRLRVWDPRSRKCQTGNFQGSLVGRAEWKPSSMWGERERTFGLCFAACRWLCPPLKCQSRPSRNAPKRTRSLYFSRVIIYVPAMVFNWVSPYTKTSHMSPRNQMVQGEVTAKVGNSWEFLELWIHHMQNSACEKTAWVTLWEILCMRSKTLQPRFPINHVRLSVVFASFKMLKHALWHVVSALGASSQLMRYSHPPKNCIALLIFDSNDYIPAEKKKKSHTPQCYSTGLSWFGRGTLGAENTPLLTEIA